MQQMQFPLKQVYCLMTWCHLCNKCKVKIDWKTHCKVPPKDHTENSLGLFVGKKAIINQRSFLQCTWIAQSILTEEIAGFSAISHDELSVIHHGDFLKSDNVHMLEPLLLFICYVPEFLLYKFIPSITYHS